jgi:hypothetical protein|tara:strand:+ start:3443 stop:4258 length:816 start_codon:yes stop_codon:yes gene_type:complete
VVEQKNPNLDTVTPETEAVVPDQDGGEGEGQPEEVNWEERAAAAETENAKLKSNLSTLEGRVKKQIDTDALFAGFSDQLMGIQAGTAAVARAMANDNLEGLGEEVDAIEQRIQARTADTVRQSVSASLGQDLQMAVQGSDGEPVLDLMEAPELETVRTTWNIGLKQLSSTDAVERAEGRATLVQAISDAKTVTLAAERTKAQQALVDLEAKHVADRAKWAEDNGVEDLSTGTGSASVSGNLFGKLGDPNITVTRDDITKAAEQFRKNGIRI